MSWLLDTDVICQQDRCYTSAVVIAQLAYWVRTKDGLQRQVLQAWLTRLVDALQGRVHGFNVSVAHVWADDRDRQRSGLQTSWTQSIQSVQGTQLVSRGLAEQIPTSSGPSRKVAISHMT